MSWEMQMKFSTGEWLGISPTGREEPYRVPTAGQAKYMMHICYPDSLREMRLGAEDTLRVWEVDEPVNIDYPCPASFETQIPYQYTPEEQKRLDEMLAGAIETDPGEDGEELDR